MKQGTKFVCFQNKQFDNPRYRSPQIGKLYIFKEFHSMSIIDGNGHYWFFNERLPYHGI
jgi:hypothetical protein